MGGVRVVQWREGEFPMALVGPRLSRDEMLRCRSLGPVIPSSPPPASPVGLGVEGGSIVGGGGDGCANVD